MYANKTFKDWARERKKKGKVQISLKCKELQMEGNNWSRPTWKTGQLGAPGQGPDQHYRLQGPGSQCVGRKSHHHAKLERSKQIQNWKV